MNIASIESPRTFVTRVVANDAFRKGIAGALAGALVALVSESLWPKDG